MLYFLVDRYEKFLGPDLSKLDEFDAIGTNKSQQPLPHFSGNFWWANTNHLRRLGPITTGEKYDAEWWVLSMEAAHLELYNSNTNHYCNPFPANLYVDINN